MNKELLKYFENGISIDKLPNGKYSIFTVKTQRFVVDSLEELTPERFERAIQIQLERETTQEEFMKVALGEEVKIEEVPVEKSTFEYFKSILDLPKSNKVIIKNLGEVEVGPKYRMVLTNGGEYGVYVHSVYFKNKKLPNLNEVGFIVEEIGRLEILSIGEIKKMVVSFKLF